VVRLYLCATKETGAGQARNLPDSLTDTLRYQGAAP
jgi:hypothetical protein